MALVKTNRSKRQKTLEVIVLNTLPHWTSVFLINYCMGVYGYYPVSGYYPVIIFSWPVSGRLLSGTIRYYPVSGKTVSGTSLHPSQTLRKSFVSHSDISKLFHSLRDCSKPMVLISDAFFISAVAFGTQVLVYIIVSTYKLDIVNRLERKS
jgi:hypothetical protein